MFVQASACCFGKLVRRHCGLRALVLTCAIAAPATAALAQTQPAETPISIVKPTVDKSAGTVTIPAAFWNPHAADWVETALSGRPSDFLHETVLCVTTTRSLLEQGLRDIGCRDGDAWADSVKDFPRVRGDRLLVLLDIQRDGKKETYSLDELLEYQQWGVALGPFGLQFRGDPDRAASRRAPAAGEPDATKILKDDPQIALQFKGLQSISQSFADHPLAYDDTWQYEPMNWWRNAAVLPAKVYESNGELPVTLTFKRVTDEQLLTEDARVWHDEAARQAILKQLPLARQIDQEKTQYMKLREAMPALKATPQQQRDAEKELSVMGMATVVAAQIERDYAALDAAWAGWALDHVKWETDDAKARDALKDLAGRWREHMNLEAERTAQLAVAEQAAYDAKRAALAPPSEELKAKLAVLRGKELEARSRALLADNKQAIDRWVSEKVRLAPNDPRNAWINEVTLHVALTGARKEAADAGIAYGTSLQKTPADAAEQGKLARAYELATIRATLGEKRLDLSAVNFEIEKRESFPEDPDLPTLKKQRDQLQQQVKTLEAALPPI